MLYIDVISISIVLSSLLYIGLGVFTTYVMIWCDLLYTDICHDDMMRYGMTLSYTVRRVYVCRSDS